MAAQEKKQVRVKNTEELAQIVEHAISTGRTDINLHFDASMLLDPEVYVLLERLQDEHPNSQSEARTEEEIISYSQSATEQQEYKGVAYKVERVSDGFACKIISPCGSTLEPWSCSFESMETADLHARAYIDSLAKPENPEKDIEA